MKTGRCWVYRLALATFALASGGCGSANKDNCKDSLLTVTAGECPDVTGGETNGGSGGSAMTAGGTGAVGSPSTTGGGGGTGGGTGADPQPVFTTGFELGDDLGSGDWVFDSTHTQTGSSSAHPDSLPDFGTATISIDCGKKQHTLLSFRYSSTPAAKQELAFSVDGDLYEMLPATYATTFARRQIAVSKGPHEYSWKVSIETGATPAFYLDDITCMDFDLQTPSGLTDFDDGQIPFETSGTWKVDSANPFNDGFPSDHELAARPPIIPDMKSAALGVQCPLADATVFSFKYGAVFAAGQNLSLSFDQQLYEALPSTYQGTYAPKDIVLPSGSHEIGFDVSVEAKAIPGLWVDSVTCKHFDPAPFTGRVDFDEGVIPNGFSGDWSIDSFQAHMDGVSSRYELSAHPPRLEPNVPASATLSCDRAHVQLKFMYAYSPAAGDEFNLYIEPDSTPIPLPATYFGEYKEFIKNFTSRPATYRWEAKTTTAKRPHVFLDTIQCNEQ